MGARLVAGDRAAKTGAVADVVWAGTKFGQLRVFRTLFAAPISCKPIASDASTRGRHPLRIGAQATFVLRHHAEMYASSG